MASFFSKKGVTGHVSAFSTFLVITWCVYGIVSCVVDFELSSGVLSYVVDLFYYCNTCQQLEVNSEGETTYQTLVAATAP